MAVVKLAATHLAKPLFHELGYVLAVDSILGGITKGLVFADNPDNPRTSLLWNLMDTLIVAGHTKDDQINKELNWLLKAVVFPNARQRYVPSLTLYYSPTWREQENILLDGFVFTHAHRRYYQFMDLTLDWTTQIPYGGQVRPLDRNVILDDSLGNISEVRGWVSSFWSSIESFETHGLGFCLLLADTVVSWCLVVYASGRQVELGLATVAEYRNRGYATLVGGACIELCLRHDKIPQWHTFEDNQPSIAVAEKLGFGLPQIYPVYRLIVEDIATSPADI